MQVAKWTSCSWLFVSALLVFWPMIAPAQIQRPTVQIVWTQDPPEIDGNLDDAAWEGAALIDNLLQVIPVPGAQPTRRTDVRILTDGEFIYFGIRCHDTDPSGIVANIMLRDAPLYFNDSVAIGLDTFHDGRNGYAFEVNPRGSRNEALIEGDADNESWRTLWFAEASIDSGGWNVEIAIPFHSLNFDPSSDVWGFNFSRHIRRDGELMRWSDSQPQRNVADFAVAGTLTGMLGINQGLGITLRPSATAARIDEYDGSDPHYQVEPSVNAFYNFLPSVVASVTANTGFAETEVDDRQVNLTRFGLFYPEKRDFFLQDALIFSFANYQARGSYKNGLPFDSRRIGLTQNPSGEPIAVDILAGGKVTGRVGPVNFGVMDVVLDSHDEIGRKNLAVGRVALNVLKESTVGVIYTHGDPSGEADNSLYGMDLNYQNSNFNGRQTLRGQAWFTKSSTSGVDDQQASYGALLEYPNDRTEWKLGIIGVQENYNPMLGFANRRGIRRYSGRYRNRIRRNAYIRTIDSSVSGYLVTNDSNDIQSGRFDLVPLVVVSEVGDAIIVAYRHDYERLDADFEIHPGVVIPAGRYPVNRGYIRIDSSHNRPLQFALQMTTGGFYSGIQTTVAPEISWRPNYHWLFEVDYFLNDVRLAEGNFKTHLLRARVNVQFTPNLAWITVAQWDNVTDSAGINSRLRWIIEDGREVFLVFNQGLDTKDGIRATRSEPLIKLEWSFRF